MSLGIVSVFVCDDLEVDECKRVIEIECSLPTNS
jgi:hypothetical protein